MLLKWKNCARLAHITPLECPWAKPLTLSCSNNAAQRPADQTGYTGRPLSANVWVWAGWTTPVYIKAKNEIMTKPAFTSSSTPRSSKVALEIITQAWRALSGFVQWLPWQADTCDRWERQLEMTINRSPCQQYHWHRWAVHLAQRTGMEKEPHNEITLQWNDYNNVLKQVSKWTFTKSRQNGAKPKSFSRGRSH